MSHAYPSLRERFEFYTTPEPNTGCWLWLAAVDRKGYARIGLGGGSRRTVFASHVAWKLHRGPIPDGLWVLHKCDTPQCVNPDHLFLGRHSDNMADMAAKGRVTCYWQKLTCDDVAAIQLLTSLGAPRAAVADVFGVSDATIRRAILGQTCHTASSRRFVRGGTP